MIKRQKIGILIGLLVLLCGCVSFKGWIGEISPSFRLGHSHQPVSTSTKLQRDDITFLTLTLSETSESGQSQLEGQFQNNSSHTIRWLNLDLLLHGEIEQTLSFYFTILPGEKSPIIRKDVGSPTIPKESILNGWGEKSPTIPKESILNSWGEKSPMIPKESILNSWGEKSPTIDMGVAISGEDRDVLVALTELLSNEGTSKGEVSTIEIRGLSVEYIASDQAKYYYHYDGLTNLEHYSESGPFVCETPPFEVEDLHLQELQLVDDEIHQTFYVSTYLKNNSIYKLSEITYTYLLPNGTTDSLSTYQQLFPGERSSKVYGEGPSSLNPDDLRLLKITYTIEEEDDQIHVEYDVLLDCYQVHHQ